MNLVSRVTLNQVLTSIRMHSSQFLSLHILFFFSFETVIPKRFAPDDEKLKILSIFKHSHCIDNLYFLNHQYVNFHHSLLLITLIFKKYYYTIYIRQTIKLQS